MRRKSLLIIALLGAWAVARAEDAPATTAHGDAASDTALTRDPFWPVGYAPRSDAPAPAPTAAVGEEPKAGLQINNLSPEQQAALGRKVRVSGIMKTGASYLARLNNQLVGEGDEITVDFEGSSLTLIVRSISKDSVQIEPKPQ